MRNQLFRYKLIPLVLVITLLFSYVPCISYAQGRPKIYWAEGKNIKRANLDGSNVEDVLTELGLPEDIALDLPNLRIYWTEYRTGKIKMANLNGDAIVEIVNGFPRLPSGNLHIRCKNGKCEGRVTPNEGEPFVIPHNLLNAPSCITHAKNKIYWGNNRHYDGIRRANLDGTDIEDIIHLPLYDPVNIALDIKSGKMYWTDRFHDKVLRANMDGSHIEHLVPERLEPHGLALDLRAGQMYWTMNFAGLLQRSDLNGENLENLVTGLSHPLDIALDLREHKIYWVDCDRGRSMCKIQRANLDGSNITDVLTELNYVRGIALDTEGVYDVSPDTNKLTTTWANMKTQ